MSKTDDAREAARPGPRSSGTTGSAAVDVAFEVSDKQYDLLVKRLMPIPTWSPDSPTCWRRRLLESFATVTYAVPMLDRQHL